MSVPLSKQWSCRKASCSLGGKDILEFNIQTNISCGCRYWKKLNLMYLAAEAPEVITGSNYLSKGH